MADQIKVVPNLPVDRAVTTPEAATQEAAGPEVAALVAAAPMTAGLVEVTPAEADPTMTAAPAMMAVRTEAAAPATMVVRAAAAGQAAIAVLEDPVREVPDRMILVAVTDLVAMTTDGVLRRRRADRG